MKVKADSPLEEGPCRFLKTIAALAGVFAGADSYQDSLGHDQKAPAHERVVRTLRAGNKDG